MGRTAEKRNIRSLLRRILAGFSTAILILLVFLLLFGAFERISLQAIVTAHSSFSHHMSTLSETMESLVQTMATQIYHISSANKLRTAQEMTTFDRIYALREVGQYTSSSPMLQSIYIFNDAKQFVYSTDELFFSAPFDTFSDKDALAIYTNRTPLDRGVLAYRVIQDPVQLPYSRPSYSFLQYETDAKGNPLPGGILLNLDPAYFRNRLLTFPGDNTIILDRTGLPVAAQYQALVPQAQALLPQVLDAAEKESSGFIIRNVDGERHLVLYTAIQTGGWVVLRLMPYEEALPGLHRIRNGAAILLGTAFTLLLAGSIVVFLRIYQPFKHIKARLVESRPGSGQDETKAVDKLERIIETSQQLKQEEALRKSLTGQSIEDNILPLSPWILLMVEHENHDTCKAIAQSIDEEAVRLSITPGTLLLFPAHAGMEPLAICEKFTSILQCRCYYGSNLQDTAALSACYKHLLELNNLRMLYPGQQVFHEALINNHMEPGNYPAEEGNAVLSALRSGDEKSLRQAFALFIGSMRKASSRDIAFALRRLMTQVNALATDSSSAQRASVMDELIASYNSIDALFEDLSPDFQAASAAQAEIRQQKVTALARQVVQRLEQGYADPHLGVKQIADEMGISPAYLRRQFFDAYHMSISDYLNQVRIKQTQHLLQTTDLSVEAIARQVGFDNHKYLFVLFKKSMGMTPRAYANQFRGVEGIAVTGED